MTKKIYIYDNPETEISFLDEKTPIKDIVPLGTDALANFLGSNVPSGAIDNLVCDVAMEILKNFPDLIEHDLKYIIWNGVERFIERKNE